MFYAAIGDSGGVDAAIVILHTSVVVAKETHYAG